MMKKNKTPVLLILTVLLTLLLSSTAFAGRWEYAGNGWKFYRDNGTYANNIMLKIDGKWYAFDNYSLMVTNQWVQAEGDWHYCTNSGAVATNQWIDGKYYVGNDGVMLTNTWTPDGYWVNELGEWDPSKSSGQQSASSQQSSGIPSEYYTIDGYYDNRSQAGYYDDYRVDAWVEVNPADDYLATLNFGLYTPTSTGYSLYDSVNPNGDTINIATADGLNWGGRSTISDKWYNLTYNGSDEIVLQWRSTGWTSSGRLVFKKRSGGRKLQYWSGGGVG